jgi:16S rRNA G966 N2-methylase RsmD
VGRPEKSLSVVDNDLPNHNQSVLSTIDKTDKHNTREEIASELGWSTGKTAQADYVWKHGDEKIKEKIKQGEESFNSAYKVISKENRTKEIAEERQKIAESAKAISNTDRWNIHQADIRTWQADKHYDYIITDPPYPKEFLPLYEVLAERASGWLRPGGLLIAMCGQSYLNQIYEIMSRHMDYYWTACYHTPGQPTPLRQVNVNTTWKPLLIFTARDQTYKGKIFGDVFKSDGNDKDFHKWGQSVSGMSDIIKKICIPGQYILDPFCGAGTTGIAAIKNGCLFDGVDIDQENVNIAKGRLNDTKEE